MLDNLPTEITDNILHRLPVEILVRCTALSKSYFSLITSRAFTSTLIAQKTTPRFLLRYFTDDKKEMYHFEPDNDEFSGFQTQGLLVPFNDMTGVWFNIVGSANGVLCLVNDCSAKGIRIILWNPSIRKYVHVPHPRYLIHLFRPYASAYGFGYDSVLDDYKVVRVVNSDTKDKGTVFEIYSLKSGCWKPMGVGPNYILNIRGHNYTPCFFHGSVHWVCLELEAYKEYKYEILKFDMFLETFDIIKIPSNSMLNESDERSSQLLISVQECMGMLSVIFKGGESACSVWVMKEYGVVNSWSKIFDFSNLHQQGYIRAFGFRKNGEVIIIRSSDDVGADVVASVDPLTNVVTLIGEIYAHHKRNSFYLSSYVESMELFHEGKRIEDLPEDLKAKPRNTDPRRTFLRRQIRAFLNRVPSQTGQ